MEWINLQDQMPPLSEWVLGYTEGGGVYTIRRVNEKAVNGHYKRTDWMIPAYLNDEIVFTHWMHMPPAPIGQNGRYYVQMRFELKTFKKYTEDDLRDILEYGIQNLEEIEDILLLDFKLEGNTLKKCDPPVDFIEKL